MISAMAVSALALAPIASARADLTDIAFVEQDGMTHLWIAFDQQPQSLTFGEGGDLVLEVTGSTVPQMRQISPYVAGPVQAIELRPTEQGVTIVVSGSFENADAELREGGIWVSMLGGVPVDWTGPVIASRSDAPAGTGQPATPRDHDHDRDEASRHHETDVAEAVSSSASLQASSQSSEDAHVSNGETASEPMALTPQTDEVSQSEDPGLCPDTASRLVDAPWDLSLLSAHADCLASLGEVENAAGLYERVLAFDPRHFQSALGLARIRSEQGQHEAAANLFDVAASAARTDGQAVQARMAARQARERMGSN